VLPASVDSEGKLHSVTPPGAGEGGDLPMQYGYSYDPMGRLNGMTEISCPSQSVTPTVTQPGCTSNHGRAEKAARAKLPAEPPKVDIASGLSEERGCFAWEAKSIHNEFALSFQYINSSHTRLGATLELCGGTSRPNTDMLARRSPYSVTHRSAKPSTMRHNSLQSKETNELVPS
jgi:hypothetical protein